MIKTDKVIYRTRTQEEYDWLMEKLEADGVRWVLGSLLTEVNIWERYSTEMGVRLEGEIMGYANFDFYENYSAYKDYEFIEVSDLIGGAIMEISIESRIKNLVSAELERANSIHPPFASPHEGYAVLLEEVEELIEATETISEHMQTLWTYTRTDEHTVLKKVKAGNIKQAAINAAMEAIQVAAMCEKYKGLSD